MKLRLKQKLIIEGSKSTRLMVNEGNTKYMILSHKNYNQQSLAVKGMLFERVNTFKYLGVESRA